MIFNRPPPQRRTAPRQWSDPDLEDCERCDGLGHVAADEDSRRARKPCPECNGYGAFPASGGYVTK